MDWTFPRPGKLTDTVVELAVLLVVTLVVLKGPFTETTPLVVVMLVPAGPVTVTVPLERLSSSSAF